MPNDRIKFESAQSKSLQVEDLPSHFDIARKLEKNIVLDINIIYTCSWVIMPISIRLGSHFLRLTLTTVYKYCKIQWMDNEHGLHDGPVFTIDRSSKSQRRC